MNWTIRNAPMKLWAVELVVLVGTILGISYAIDAGVLSMFQGLVVFAVVSVSEILLDAHVTG